MKCTPFVIKPAAVKNLQERHVFLSYKSFFVIVGRLEGTKEGREDFGAGRRRARCVGRTRTCEVGFEVILCQNTLHQMEDRLDPFSITGKEKAKVVDEGEMSAASTPSIEPHVAWVEGGEGDGKLMTWSCDWKFGFRNEVAQHGKTCTRSHEQGPFVERRWILTAGPSHTGDREVSNIPHPRHSAQHL